MNSVIFNIRKLGAVRDSKIELKPFMLFSGESGLGKSYVAFLVHYLYKLLLSDRMNSFFTESNIDFKAIFEKRKSGEIFFSLSSKDLFAWINRDAIRYIGYLIGHENFDGDVEIVFPYNKLNFDFKYEEDLGGLDNHEELIYKIELDNFVYRVVSRSFQVDSDYFSALVKAVLLNAIWETHSIFKHCYLMPPSRGALMELTERPPFRSGMYEEFFDLKVDLGRPVSNPVKLNATILECLSDVNVGTLQQVYDGRIIYYTKSGVEMPLTAAASSIKELAPFTMMLNKFGISALSVLFEEPEAHLHPDRQVKVADLIACVINNGCHMQVTTHSDYLIKRINNLMKIYILKKKMVSSEASNLLSDIGVKEDCLINPELVGAFLLKSDGEGYSMIVTQDIKVDLEIPFESFYQVIDDDIQLSGKIRDLFKKNKKEEI